METVAMELQSKGGQLRQQTHHRGWLGWSSKAGARVELEDFMAKHDGAKVVSEKGKAVLGIAAGCKRWLIEAPHSSATPSDGDADGDTEDDDEKE